MTASWDRRSPSEHARIERLTLARWLPAVVASAPRWHDHALAAEVAAKDLIDRKALQRLAPSRGIELADAGGPGGPALVMRPDEDQLKAYADGEMLARMVAAMRRDQEVGRRETMLHEFRPVQVHRAGPAGRLDVVSTRSDLDRMHRVGARAAQVLGLRDDDVVLNGVGMRATLSFYGLYHLCLGASLLAAHPRGTDGELGAVVDAAAALRPTVVIVEPEDALTVAAALTGADRLGRLRLVVSLGPPPDDDTRGQIREAFAAAGADVEVLALWAPAEHRALWAECAPGHGLHTYPDLELLEVIDPLTGRPSEADGDLTLTSMGWHGTALLRLQSGTWVDPLATDACPACERTVPRIVGDVAPAAWEVTAAVANGRVVVDLRGVPAVLSQTPGATAWRVEVRGPEHGQEGDRLVVEVAGDLDPDDVAQLPRRLAAGCAIVPEVVTGLDPDEIKWAVEEAGGPFADTR